MTIRWYVGFDPRDQGAMDVAIASAKKHATAPLDIRPLKDWELRRAGVYWRAYYVGPDGTMTDERDDKPFSTAFSYTRFCIPLLDESDDWVLWTDPDVLWRADIAELRERADDGMIVMCVKHEHNPKEKKKLGGTSWQHRYPRKNWSSVMLMRPARCRRHLTRYAVNNSSKAYLSGLLWAPEQEIGDLPVAWNWLAGWSPETVDPKLVHFTRGTPDMPGHEDEPFADEWRSYLKK